jgi:hypothetical protein
MEEEPAAVMEQCSGEDCGMKHCIAVIDDDLGILHTRPAGV